MHINKWLDSGIIKNRRILVFMIRGMYAVRSTILWFCRWWLGRPKTVQKNIGCADKIKSLCVKESGGIKNHEYSKTKTVVL